MNMASKIINIPQKAYDELYRVIVSPAAKDQYKIVLGSFIFMPIEEGLPIGFEFPFHERDSWNKCCDELRKQGWKITKWLDNAR